MLMECFINDYINAKLQSIGIEFFIIQCRTKKMNCIFTKLKKKSNAQEISLPICFSELSFSLKTLLMGYSLLSILCISERSTRQDLLESLTAIIGRQQSIETNGATSMVGKPCL